VKSKAPAAYNSVAVTDTTFDKLNVWQMALSKRYGYRFTKSMTIDWLIDNAGVPPEED